MAVSFVGLGGYRFGGSVGCVRDWEKVEGFGVVGLGFCCVCGIKQRPNKQGMSETDISFLGYKIEKI